MNVMSKKIVRYLSILLAVSVLFSGISLQITTAFADNVAEEETPTTETAPVVSASSDLQDYVEYTKGHGITNKATSKVQVPVTAFAADGADVTVDNTTLIWNSGEGSVTLTFDVPETALYNLQFVWEPKDSGVDIEMGVMLDGKYQFDGSDEIILSRLWKNVDTKPETPDTEEPRTDGQGNEYAQEQEEIDGPITTIVRDYEGAIIDPFEFALTAGTHTITLTKPEQSITIESITFIEPETVKSYKDVSASYDVKDLDADIITIQGENANVKSSNSMIPKSNNSDAGMTSHDGKANDYFLTKINYIGGTSWQTTGSTITWNFNVDKAGYY